MSNTRILILAGIGLGVVAVILAITTGVENLWWILLLFATAMYAVIMGVRGQQKQG